LPYAKTTVSPSNPSFPKEKGLTPPRFLKILFASAPFLLSLGYHPTNGKGMLIVNTGHCRPPQPLKRPKIRALKKSSISMIGDFLLHKHTWMFAEIRARTTIILKKKTNGLYVLPFQSHQLPTPHAGIDEQFSMLYCT
jgi:hypothetical protein